MARSVNIDGVEYDLSSLSADARSGLQIIAYSDARIAELQNMQALLVRAKKSYIDGLEREIVKARTGVDFNSLLSD